MRPKKHLERYCITEPEDESFLFEIGDKKYLYVGESVLTFTTNGNIAKYGLYYGFDDIKFPYVYDQSDIYCMLDKKI